MYVNFDSLVGVNKPWGAYVEHAQGKNWKSKLLIVKPKGETSLQTHEHRKELWVVLQGSGVLEVSNSKYRTGHALRTGNMMVIPAKVKHRIRNNSTGSMLVIAEFWFGEVLSEDDIVRYEDKYGRVLEK